MAKNKITNTEIASEAALDQISGGGISKRTLAEILGSVAAVGTVAGIIVGAAWKIKGLTQQISNQDRLRETNDSQIKLLSAKVTHLENSEAINTELRGRLTQLQVYEASSKAAWGALRGIGVNSIRGSQLLDDQDRVLNVTAELAAQPEAAE